MKLGFLRRCSSTINFSLSLSLSLSLSDAEELQPHKLSSLSNDVVSHSAHYVEAAGSIALGGSILAGTFSLGLALLLFQVLYFLELGAHGRRHVCHDAPACV